MIQVKNLRPALFEVSGILKGVKLFKDELTAENLQKQIKEDLGNFQRITKVNISVNLENYEDARSYYDCVLMNIQMLIQFNQKDNNEALQLIKKYLETTYVSPIN